VIVTAKLELKTRMGAGGEEIEEARMLANRITPIETASAISETRERDAEMGRRRKIEAREARQLAENPPRMRVRLSPDCDCDCVVNELRRAIYDHPGTAAGGGGGPGAGGRPRGEPRPVVDGGRRQRLHGVHPALSVGGRG
jgi:hypothetical protein